MCSNLSLKCRGLGEGREEVRRRGEGLSDSTALRPLEEGSVDVRRRPLPSRPAWGLEASSLEVLSWRE